MRVSRCMCVPIVLKSPSSSICDLGAVQPARWQLAASTVLSYIREKRSGPPPLFLSVRWSPFCLKCFDRNLCQCQRLLIYLLPHLPLYLWLQPTPSSFSPNPMLPSLHTHKSIFFIPASLKSLVYAQFLSAARSLWCACC